MSCNIIEVGGKINNNFSRNYYINKKELNERHKSRRTQMKDALKSQGHVPSMLPTAKSHQVNKLGG